jgi:hypothetical protein
MILIINQKKKSTHEINEYTYIDVCIKEYYTPLETSKIENKAGVDINNVNAEQRKNNSKLVETIIKRISVKTQKLSIRMLGKRCNSKESQFPSIIKMSKIENNLEDFNLFPKHYDEYNATKILIKKMKCTKEWKFAMKQKETMTIIDCSNVSFKKL